MASSSLTLFLKPLMAFPSPSPNCVPPTLMLCKSANSPPRIMARDWIAAPALVPPTTQPSR